jgi:nitrite reductase/ring-hydroxylating ferredoxin subunit
LATGALIGEKLICPTCGSNFDILSGFVDQGPSMRNISNFNVNIREEHIKVTMPEHVPAFQHKKYLKK